MENKQTAVEWLVNVVQSCIVPDYIPKEIVEQAKQMEHQHQVELLEFSRKMCTPEAPIDYIIKEFNKWKKN